MKLKALQKLLVIKWKERNKHQINPKPIDTIDVELSQEIMDFCEKISENTHEVREAGRIAQGWTYGPARDDAKKETPCLVPYNELPESEKEYDRNTALETIKQIIKMGYSIALSQIDVDKC